VLTLLPVSLFIAAVVKSSTWFACYFRSHVRDITQLWGFMRYRKKILRTILCKLMSTRKCHSLFFRFCLYNWNRYRVCFEMLFQIRQCYLTDLCHPPLLHFIRRRAQQSTSYLRYHHRLNGSSSPVLTATSLSYGEAKNSTPTESKPLIELR